MSSSRKSGTRYANTGTVDFYLDQWVPVTIEPTYTDKKVILEAKYHERPDLLSNDEYGTPKYWWVFMERNKDVIFDPIFDFKAGIVIFIPPIESLGGT